MSPGHRRSRRVGPSGQGSGRGDWQRRGVSAWRVGNADEATRWSRAATVVNEMQNKEGIRKHIYSNIKIKYENIKIKYTRLQEKIQFLNTAIILEQFLNTSIILQYQTTPK